MKTSKILTLALLASLPALAAPAQQPGNADGPKVNPKTEKALENISKGIVSFLLDRNAPKGETPPKKTVPIPDFTVTAPTAPADGGSLAPPSEEIAAEFEEAEYITFAYSFDEEGLVQRVIVTKDLYELNKRNEVDNRYYWIYRNFLLGNYGAYPDDYPEPMGQIMVNMDPIEAARFRQSPEYLHDMARSMAEWTFYYMELDMWKRYLEQNVLFRPLAGEELFTFNPAMIEEAIPYTYENLASKGRESVQDQKSIYDQMVELINQSRFNQQEYDSWFEEYRDNLELFANRWGRQYDGSEIRIDDVLYIVRNISDRPENPADDYDKDSIPRNAVLLDVPKEKVVTPFDLIKEDGALRTPEDG